MSKTHWARTRAANQPSARKKRAYDKENAVAAAVILADTQKHTAFQISWAHAFRRRQDQEGDRGRQADANGEEQSSTESACVNR